MAKDRHLQYLDRDSGIKPAESFVIVHAWCMCWDRETTTIQSGRVHCLDYAYIICNSLFTIQLFRIMWFWGKTRSYQMLALQKGLRKGSRFCSGLQSNQLQYLLPQQEQETKPFPRPSPVVNSQRKISAAYHLFRSTIVCNTEFARQSDMQHIYWDQDQSSMIYMQLILRN